MSQLVYSKYDLVKCIDSLLICYLLFLFYVYFRETSAFDFFRNLRKIHRQSGVAVKMKTARFIKYLFLVIAFLSPSAALFGQPPAVSGVKSLEVSEADSVPVLIKHLPDWESVRNSATFTNNTADLRRALGERPVLDLIDFTGGTEAVAAAYPQGKLLIVEHATPQASVEMDTKTVQRLNEIGQTANIYYRRIGNYNVFVFDAPDETAANSLLDQIKYEKDVQWLGENPFMLRRAERAFIHTTSDIFIATVMVIVLGIGTAILTGLIVGFVFFRFRDQRRAMTTAFSDAGGMTRLNLDDLSVPIGTEKLLKD